MRESWPPVFLIQVINRPQEVEMARDQLMSVLACLRCEGRVIRETPTDQDAVKELARDIAKVIAPVVTQDQGSSIDNDSLEGRHT